MSVTTREALFETPEIDAVRLSLENGITELGDHLSDRYWTLINTATDPRILKESFQEERRRRVVRIVSEFQTNNLFVQRSLAHGSERYDIPNLPELFDSVIAQTQALVGIDAPN